MTLTDWIRGVFVASTLVRAAYTLYTVLREALSERNKNDESTISRVLFFPDKELLRQTHERTLDVRRSRSDAQPPRCRQQRGVTALEVILRHIRDASQSLDVCVFTITCYELARAVVDAHCRGVIVRVITDSEHVLSAGSQVLLFRREGIQVREDDSSFHMHHKFVVVDKKTLINGSFNWTRNAVTGNRENVMISEGGNVTHRFVEEFERLWREFNPETR
ncbi:mitochondrial cardiolipin hydrolase-like [Corticium candelabrum]|uniref:mitochondrial cardiolipin hydrolase-like n=1 Tax=Corticium candelabrum TaxID=121492 RepID=UPI002E321C15|nr:mitochondrial cardiolipin hydrolase-like [Corticium candelabrum]